MWLDKWTPKKFLWKYSLQCGAKVVGVIMTIIIIICIIATAVQVGYMGSCRGCPVYTFRTAYAYSVTAIIYCIAMLIVTVWFFYGVSKKKSSVVLAYAVIGSLWLVLCLCLLIVLICLYSKEADVIAWVLSLIFGLLAIAILCYCFLVVYGYWRQTKTSDMGNATE